MRKWENPVIIDLNRYYYEFARELFPNAQIIADRFHIVQMMTRFLIKHRLILMKQHSKNSFEYGALKLIRRLCLEHTSGLKAEQQLYGRHLKMTLTES